MKYFAYGSNMDKKDFIERTKTSGTFFNTGKAAILKDYELRFNKKSINWYAAANIMPKMNNHVEGVLFDISDSDVKTIDSKEGVPIWHTGCNSLSSYL